MKIKFDHTGQRFGRLFVAERVANRNGEPAFRCVCDCSNESVVLGKHLRYGKTISCGCYARERSTTHGLARSSGRHPLYTIWYSMMQRCFYKHNDSFNNYGGRGIKVCDRWQNPSLFFEDMRPTWCEGMSLDRIDPNGDYEPDNCRWVSFQEQARNRRSNRMVDTPWGVMTLVEASERSGVNYQKLHGRLRRGAPLFNRNEIGGAA